MQKALFGIALAIVLSAPAAMGAENVASAQPSRNDVVCKSMPNSTSMLRRRVCMREYQWQMLEANDRAQLADLQKRSLALPLHM